MKYLIAITLMFFCGAAFAWPATLVKVADGDTITVINNTNGNRVRVRLAGIDAPEVDHGKGRPGQPLGMAAQGALASILLMANIEVHPNGTTSYGRIVATVTANGKDVATQMVAVGLARDYPRYDRQHKYTAAERSAKKAGKGVWSRRNAVAPWAWRHQVWSH